ncbi:hypothetical protein C8F01DRAFT_1098483 [Mycena amicta]|nr:hypothetical protein C8F01DRAFT_1098483 [Mycena amicta]
MEIFDDPASPNTIATFELPGVKPQTGHLDVVVTKNKLVVRGQRLARFGVDSEPESHTPQKLSLFPLRELRYGSFYRAVTLPRGVDATGMTTSFKDGLLTISWARPDPGVGNTTGNKDNAATDGCDEEGEEDENTSGLGSRAASGRLISNRNNQTWEDVPGRGGRERC